MIDFPIQLITQRVVGMFKRLTGNVVFFMAEPRTWTTVILVTHDQAEFELVTHLNLITQL